LGSPSSTDWIPVAESVLRLAGLEATAANALVLIDTAFQLFGAGVHRLVVLAANNPPAATAAVGGLLWWWHRHGYLTRDNWRRRLSQAGGMTKPPLELAEAGTTEHQALSWRHGLQLRPRTSLPAWFCPASLRSHQARRHHCDSGANCIAPAGWCAISDPPDRAGWIDVLDALAVPGADEDTPLVAVSRSGFTVDGLAATSGPEQLMEAWGSAPGR
jgi:hypothetical protein